MISFSQTNFTKFVNPFIGTSGHGHTFPGATLPFGMVQLSPDTRTDGWDACSGYHYSDSTLIGFSHTHLSGTGIADYGDILIIPTKNKSKRNTKLKFSKKNEVSNPGFYKTFIDDESILVELTSTLRVGIHQYTFSSNDKKVISLDLKHGLGDSEVLKSEIKIDGKSSFSGYRQSRGWAQNQIIYFAAEFSKNFSSKEIFGNNNLVNSDTITGKDIFTSFYFDNKSPKKIILKVALSHTSVENAKINLRSEATHWDFNKYKTDADEIWNLNLSKIKIETKNKSDKIKFYTALYHSMIAPNISNDVSGEYRTMDNKIKSEKNFSVYTVFSLWDTFRSLHPLLTLIDSTRTDHFAKSLLVKQNESGLLPVWELSSNETWCMIGYHSVSVLLDAFVKNKTTLSAEKILDAMINSAEANHFGLNSYKNFCYVNGVDEGESVSKTLEYAYDDWCIAEMAKIVGRNDLYKKYILRSQNYKNIFDNKSGFMRAKINSRFETNFNPTSVSTHFTEANSWQYSFFAPHDIFGLTNLFGNQNNLENKLDSLFHSSNNLTGRAQADITGLIGQYAQGNEPSHNFAYLYNFTSSPWKTQNIVRKILDSLYTENADGLCGNDDCGQLSSWYVLSSIGIYPFTPGSKIFTLSSPIFDFVEINFGNEKFLKIKVIKEDDESKFIEDVKLNGKTISQFLNYDDFKNGGELIFKLSNIPNKIFGNDFNLKSEIPIELTKTPLPFFDVENSFFKDSLIIKIGKINSSENIFYSVDESPFNIYKEGFLINKTSKISAFIDNKYKFSGDTILEVFEKRTPIGEIKLLTNYSEQYPAGGNYALLDRNFGSTNFRLGSWQGFHQNDLIAIINLKNKKNISSISLSTLQDINSWIFLPEFVEFYQSNDGNNFELIEKIKVNENNLELKIEEFITLKKINSQFIKIVAKNIGVCPLWHKGAGEKAWIFADEIIISIEN